MKNKDESKTAEWTKTVKISDKVHHKLKILNIQKNHGKMNETILFLLNSLEGENNV